MKPDYIVQIALDFEPTYPQPLDSENDKRWQAFHEAMPYKRKEMLDDHAREAYGLQLTEKELQSLLGFLPKSVGFRNIFDAQQYKIERFKLVQKLQRLDRFTTECIGMD